jgi:hypothetical protein
MAHSINMDSIDTSSGADSAGSKFTEAQLGDSHDWIGAAIALALWEARRYFATMSAFCRGPQRFGARWAADDADALNPLGFVATSAAMIGVLAQVLRPLLDDSGSDSIWLALADWVRPYVLFGLFGLGGHVVLHRKRARSSIALGLYAGAGPTTIAAVLAMMVAGMLRSTLRVPAGASLMTASLAAWVRIVAWSVSLLPLVSFWGSFAPALAGLHHVSRRRAVVAVAMTQLALALIAGALPMRSLSGQGGYLLPTVIVSLTRDGRFHPSVNLSY